MPTVTAVDAVMLDHILETTHPYWHEGLTRKAFGLFGKAHGKTDYALRHQRRFALVDGASVLASAEQFDLTGTLDRRPVRICGIGAAFADPAHYDGGYERVLVDRLLEAASQDGADIALLVSAAPRSGRLSGFDVIPMMDVEIGVAPPARYGAPMMLVRSGRDGDLAAIAAMGRVRADAFRFHLNRDVDLVKHAITRRRLLAGLGAVGARELLFMVAEEGTTAVAYVVISVIQNEWTIEECGDRDPSGARVGALLQALIARAPGERRPVVCGWLPHGFIPPQITIVSSTPSAAVIMVRSLKPLRAPLQLSGADVLYWRSDLF